jgi:cell division protein FtsI/penicillin-binding protein 2
MAKYKHWRDYQNQLQRERLRKAFFKKGIWFLLFSLFIVAGIQFSKVSRSTGYFKVFPDITIPPHDATVKGPAVLAKEDLRSMIDPAVLCDSTGGKVALNYSGKTFSVKTTLDSRLQNYMLTKVRRSKSYLIGFVAMDPSTGRILSMINSKKMNAVKNACLSNQFPAASIFKIITAAAAIEGCDLSGDTQLTYNGRKHTLYKNQLTDRINRYTNRTTLKKSFAQSINPVFGKLGVFRLRKDLLEEYAVRFGFNQSIDFELPVQPSRISVGDDPYHWAEVASGFNRETVISPIHGALIASVILNGGKLVEPTIVEYIADDENNPVYVGGTRIVRDAIAPETTRELKALMAATISCGTCRRLFRGYRRDPILSKLVIGGKTGSINNRCDELHYDWFVGFCEQKTGNRKLALAAVVVHDKLLRKKAPAFARLAMRYYFDENRS